MSTQLSYNVCLLGDPHSNCFYFYLPEGAKVQDLLIAIRLSNFWPDIPNNEIICFFKCGDLDVGEEAGRHKLVLEWLHKHQNDAMSFSARLKKYFAYGPAPESDEKIDIIAVTQPMLDTIWAQPVPKDEFSTGSKDDHEHKMEVTFRIEYKENRVAWHEVDSQNGYEDIDLLPAFIENIVENPRCVEQVDDDEQTKMIALLKQIILDARADPRLLSDAVGALPYEEPLFEIRHFLLAADWVPYLEYIERVRSGITNGSKFFTTFEAYDVMFARFARYWLARVGGECQSNNAFPFTLIVDLIGSEARADPQSKPKKLAELKYTPRPDFAFLKNDLPCFLVEFDSQAFKQADKFRLRVQLACALRLAAALRRDAGKDDKNVFLMGAFVERNQIIHRYFVYRDENKHIRFHHKKFSISRHRENLMFFLFEFYNYARYVEKELITHTTASVEALRAKLSDTSRPSLTSYKPPKSEGSPPERECPTSKRPRTGSAGNQHAVISSALQEQHYKVAYDDEKGEMVSLHLPAHVVEAVAPTGNLVIAKLSRKRSSELSLLQELSSQDSPHNHVIPLIDAIPSTLGQVIISPAASPLSTHGIPDLFPDRFQGFVQLSHELVEGIAFLHRRKIAHLDIKPDNLVYDFNFRRLYIIDFDLAMRCKDVEEMVEMYCGTPGWIAPEIDRNKNEPMRAFSPIRADLWACGKVLWHFAKVTDGKDEKITRLTNSLMKSEPRLRTLLHEYVDDEKADFWLKKRGRGNSDDDERENKRAKT